MFPKSWFTLTLDFKVYFLIKRCLLWKRCRPSKRTLAQTTAAGYMLSQPGLPRAPGFIIRLALSACDPDWAMDFGSPIGITCATPPSGPSPIPDSGSSTWTVLWNAVHVFSALPPLLCSWLDFAPSSPCQYLAQVRFAMLPTQKLFSNPNRLGSTN